MSMRGGVVLLATGVLLAACSGGGGGSHAGTSPVPRGIAGVETSLGASTSPASESASHTTRHATKSPSGSPTPTSVADSTGPGATHSSRPHAGPGSSTARTTSAKPSPKPAAPSVTVTPHSGLTSGQTVQVNARGFTPGISLIVIECYDKGQATGPSDCAITHAKSVKASNTGTVSQSLVVVKKIDNVHACGNPTPCLVSVSIPSEDAHTEEADQHISFV